MGLRWVRPIGIAALVVAAAVATPTALAGPQPTDPGPGPTTNRHVVPEAEARGVKAYWTPERLAAAQPIRLPGERAGEVPAEEPAHTADVADVPPAPPVNPMPAGAAGPVTPADGSGQYFPVDAAHLNRPPLSLNGIVVATTPGGQPLRCSASVVNSPTRSMIATAAHCLWHHAWMGTGEGPVSNLMFIPHAYRDGILLKAPYGTWAVAQFVLLPKWVENLSGLNTGLSDVGLAILNNDEQGRYLQDLVGGYGLAFNGPKAEADAMIFGYPAEPKPKYNVDRLAYCVGERFAQLFPYLVNQECDMSGGASGGPWITGYDDATGLGSVVAVTHAEVGETAINGRYFDDRVATLYQQASGLGPIGLWVPFVKQSASWDTGVQLQNLDDRDAPVRLEYINSDGTIASTLHPTVAARGSLTLLNQGPVTFEGGVRISVIGASSALTATVNYFYRKQLIASARGFTSGSTRVLLPLLMHANGRADPITTFFAVQNLGRSPAHITVTYQNSDGVIGRAVTRTVAPNAALTFHQDRADLPAVFAGQVVSDQPIAVTVLQQSGRSLLAYNGFPQESTGTELGAPLVMANNSGAYTGIQVQNTAGTPTDVTVAYSANLAAADRNPCGGHTGWVPQPRTLRAAALASVSVIQNDADPQFRGCRYVGSASISSAQPIVAVVNQAGTAGSSAYEAFNLARLGPTVRAPLLNVNNSGIWSGLSIRNDDPLSEARVVITYSRNAITSPRNGLPPCGTGGTLATRTVTIASLSSAVVFYGGPGTGPNNDHQFDGCVFVGSATLHVDAGTPISAVLNQITPGITDPLATYEGA